jgi:hypothetical protein
MVHQFASPYTPLFAFHLFDVKWSNGASCVRDDRATYEIYKREESWRKHELIMQGRGGNCIIYDRTARLSLIKSN